MLEMYLPINILYAANGSVVTFYISVDPKIDFKDFFFIFSYDFGLDSKDSIHDPKYYNNKMSEVFKEIVMLDATTYDCNYAIVNLGFNNKK